MIFNKPFAAKVLRCMYNLYFAAIAVLAFAIFTFVRNLPAIIEIAPLIIEKLMKQ